MDNPRSHAAKGWKLLQTAIQVLVETGAGMCRMYNDNLLYSYGEI